MGVRERLIELIAESGMSQAEIARRIGEDRAWVNTRLRGVTDIKGDDVPRIARALRVSERAFFEPAPEPRLENSRSELVRERLRLLLRQKGWNQSELARRLGKHRTWVNYRLTGVTEIRADELPEIANALGVAPHLFFDTPAGPPSDGTLYHRLARLHGRDRELLGAMLDLFERHGTEQHEPVGARNARTSRLATREPVS
jgi:transcriptional regulator with XRE-family HTH domain